MAEETLKAAAASSEAPAAAAEVAVVPEAEKVEACEKEAVKDVAVEEEKEKVTASISFKEESNVVGELPDPQKKALDELKLLVQEALNKHEFTAPPPPPPVKEEEEEKKPSSAVEGGATVPTPVVESECKEEEKVTAVEPSVKEVTEVIVKAESCIDEDGAKKIEAIQETIVAVTMPAEPPRTEETAPPPCAAEETPISPEEISIWGIPLLADERSDVILLKFLRARDFKVKDAFAMLKNVVAWRKEFGIESLLEEDLGTEQDKVVYMHGVDKEGHPVCYNAYGEYQNKELYHETFSDEEKRTKFLRWRIQFLEKSIRKLDFSPDGICTIVFINVPWWYLAFYKMINPFFTQRTKSKFVFAGPSKTAETLFKLECLIPYLKTDSFNDFDQTLACFHTCTLVWEARVVGHEITYGAEFVPATEEGYTVIVQKSRKIAATTDEPVICGSFKCGEPGKVVLTFDNQTSKKKKVLYRSKTKLGSD
ncbi:hypothetical protein Ccrd_019114 [Cynara cardunculus var. scolymus]|uniref:CRAL-TRIO domain-containing protein n=1 Tax=Cynara cardunculus var. scolymus TaxID=59895 RepID=A0A103Y4Z7_CYNCS|nr:hypothetical protein Ccrd_019114 [Cynara cardunculus var. scolymus]